MLALAVDLVFGSDKKQRPLASYELQEGSVKHVITTLVTVVSIAGQQLDDVQRTGSLNSIDPVRAKAISSMQQLAKKKKRIYSIGIADENRPLLLTDKTNYVAPVSNQWFETELYFYGQLVDWGGANRSNIHLLTSDKGTITIPTTKELITSIEANLVYKLCRVIAIGKEDAVTGEIDYSSLKLKEIKPYNRSFYDRSYIEELGKKATQNWLGDLEDPEAWLNQLRDHAE
ncbi:hypothetical protein [Hymenobacter sp. BT559]|uniref:hypothetical protein n=1 Tax=Hymenobacter sp. BT559 TaxID=2795729 RepID=UPI0018EB1CAB|nr:hypothetical protein [Hymenobacter sp. BT559]MBJ6145759.1 hypothetical protein [Hymenobacter sp. BT559]